MSTPAERFLARWSRLKRSGGDVAAVAPVPAGTAPAAAPGAAALPDPEKLAFDDDFRAFLGREVKESLRRVALKKLFHAPQFNVMDGLDVYVDDYTIASPIDEATMRQLVHARDMLFGDPPEAAAAHAPPSADLLAPANALAAADASAPSDVPERPRPGDGHGA